MNPNVGKIEKIELVEEFTPTSREEQSLWDIMSLCISPQRNYFRLLRTYLPQQVLSWQELHHVNALFLNIRLNKLIKVIWRYS